MPSTTGTDHRGEELRNILAEHRPHGHAQRRFGLRCSCGYPLYVQYRNTSRLTCTGCRRVWQIRPAAQAESREELEANRFRFDMYCRGTRSPSNRVVRNRTAGGGRLFPNTRQGRHFGVEIECVGINPSRAAAAIREAGIEVEYESYNHRRRPHWKVTTDASVCGPGGSCEVVSPVLNGDDGHEQIRKVCRALSEAGARINRTCGLHVHIDARELGRESLANVARYYHHFESAIDTVMAPSRRGNHNSYCGSLASYDFNGETDDESVLYRARASRFTKLNLQAHSRHGTIEFRHHAGTIEANKISNWVRLAMAIVDTAGANGWNQRRLNGNGLANLLNDTNVGGETYNFFMGRASHFGFAAAA